jgi:hypothetical protein
MGAEFTYPTAPHQPHRASEMPLQYPGALGDMVGTALAAELSPSSTKSTLMSKSSGCFSVPHICAIE